MGLFGSRSGRKKGTHDRTIDRITLMVRIELSSPTLTIADICKMVGITPSRYSAIKKLPVYRIIKNQFMSGIVTDLNNKVNTQLQLNRKTLEMAVPIALSGLLQQAMTAKDERVRNKAYNDILDRDGTFAKVRRVNVAATTQKEHELNDNDKAAAELLAAMLPQSTAENNKGFKDPDINTPPITDTKQ